MAYQRSDLVASVKRRAKDQSFSSDLIIEYIQETQDKVLNHFRFRFMETSTTDTLNIGDSEFDLDTDVDVINSLSLVDTTTDQVVRPKFMGQAEFFERYDPDTASQGTPCAYTLYGSTIIFDVPMHQAWTLKTKYLQTSPVLSSDTSVPLIPERYKELLIRGGLAGVEEYRGNLDIAALHERRIEEITEDMLMRQALRQTSSSHKSRFSRRRSDDAWG